LNPSFRIGGLNATQNAEAGRSKLSIVIPFVGAVEQADRVLPELREMAAHQLIVR